MNDLFVLVDQLKGGPIEDKLDIVLTEIENGSIGFSIGQLLHVRGALQSYNNVREIKAYHYGNTYFITHVIFDTKTIS